jgi:hypothetical protein
MSVMFIGMGRPPVKKEKRELLDKVPMRRLLASIKRDLKRELRASAASRKPRKMR